MWLERDCWGRYRGKSSVLFLQLLSTRRNPIKSNPKRSGIYLNLSFICHCNSGQQMALMAKVTKFQCSNSLLHSYGLTEMLVDILWSSVTKEGFEHKAVSEISIHEIWIQLKGGVEVDVNAFSESLISFGGGCKLTCLKILQCSSTIIQILMSSGVQERISIQKPQVLYLKRQNAKPAFL